MTKTPIQSRSEAACKTVLKNLERRGFEAYYCEDKAAALAKALELIPAEDVVSWGGSVSIQEIGLLEVMRSGRYKIIDRETAETPEQRTDLLRQALLCDTFLMSSNAISEDGQLVNIDGTGNRVAAMVYGPKSVIVVAGVNKLVKTQADALARARMIAAPINTHRFPQLKTPCIETGLCADCNSPDCICNYILTTRRCKPAGKIKVILVGENLGY
ncbi:MAG: lactate utilization protein [Phascolarctobacterium sp.]|uniref:lactate utilization protein n=1 Tax=Phascolarctobacterium sp. TaxID=2049039 RepID=UPI0025CF4FAF|nr:lactate utilization protein [Phascolarctobacterium sp.]MCC8159598.1 lactate utilization protein [Phascolarctobacterium sp.]MDO5380333.1 lactate utilization protein [Acidaminococcaceae bacterium]